MPPIMSARYLLWEHVSLDTKYLLAQGNILINCHPNPLPPSSAQQKNAMESISPAHFLVLQRSLSNATPKFKCRESLTPSGEIGHLARGDFSWQLKKGFANGAWRLNLVEFCVPNARKALHLAAGGHEGLHNAAYTALTDEVVSPPNMLALRQ
ncbi:hypothetical protein RHSIM_Rhsim04G0086500 [Rhododendron simsii]|uniref:Uncharacterized protein n=1 Tax=Rhododendron simsii TaxID=118357 RepID=A0A834H2X0_RHOSS|nr:hypothetical protein RHSIM_Rhsim04G0086500 [Rhododendron simsii]